MYPSTNAGDTAYILADSQCRIVFAEDTGQLAKLTERRAEPPNLTKVVLFDALATGDWVITLADLAEWARSITQACLGCADTNRCDHPGAVGDVDLHLGNHRTAQRSAVAAFGLGV